MHIPTSANPLYVNNLFWTQAPHLLVQGTGKAFSALLCVSNFLARITQAKAQVATAEHTFTTPPEAEGEQGILWTLAKLVTAVTLGALASAWWQKRNPQPASINDRTAGPIDSPPSSIAVSQPETPVTILSAPQQVFSVDAKKNEVLYLKQFSNDELEVLVALIQKYQKESCFLEDQIFERGAYKHLFSRSTAYYWVFKLKECCCQVAELEAVLEQRKRQPSHNSAPQAQSKPLVVLKKEEILAYNRRIISDPEEVQRKLDKEFNSAQQYLDLGRTRKAATYILELEAKVRQLKASSVTQSSEIGKSGFFYIQGGASVDGGCLS